MSTSDPIVITVRYRSGTHLTNTIEGLRASSTGGYDQAAHGLCRKLFGDDVYTLAQVQHLDTAAITVFEARRLGDVS